MKLQIRVRCPKPTKRHATKRPNLAYTVTKISHPSESELSELSEAEINSLKPANGTTVSASTGPENRKDVSQAAENDTQIDTLFLEDLADIAAEGRTIDPENYRTPSPTPNASNTNPVPHTRPQHQVVHHPIRVTQKEVVLLKRIQGFVEEYEALKQALATSKQQNGIKYTKLLKGMDRHVQQHLKNGLPRIAKGRAVVASKRVEKKPEASE
ncbi:MAG: hypothetical protein Q9195_008625 [Heterodermia aff. obscurata]